MALARLSFAKLLELIITVICLILHYKSADEPDRSTVTLASGTFIAYTIILGALFAGYLLNTPIAKRIDIFLSLVGCILFLVTGGLILKTWNDDEFLHKLGIHTDARNYGIAKGSLAIINGILFLFDIGFTFRD